MNPTLATYLGFVVAFIIILWSIIELNRRYFRRKRANKRTVQTWMPLSPTLTQSSEEPVGKIESVVEEQEPLSDLKTRAQQNGHYSQPRRPM